jgi:hypothetical protein
VATSDTPQPPNKVLLEDVNAFLPLLAQLYETQVSSGLPSPGDDGQPPGSTPKRAGRQGRIADSAVRIAIEKYAEDQAKALLCGHDWAVDKVGHLKRGYDLECSHPTHGSLHVEVKGTQTAGTDVILTPNEVRHNGPATECAAQHALYVHAGVKVGGDLMCSGGRGRMLWSWTVADEALTPTEYSYKVP